MRALVVVASRHDSTRQIARAVAEELGARGMMADLREAGAVTAVEGYDAVVLGSAIYMGTWLPEARRFIERHRARLSGLPVWLFSSGPLGADDPQPRGDPPSLPDLLRATGAREHRTFGGALDAGRLGLGERLVARALHAPEGDFRDWKGIRAWADTIADALRADRVAATAQSPSPIGPGIDQRTQP